jgi:hypothetical protein
MTAGLTGRRKAPERVTLVHHPGVASEPGKGALTYSAGGDQSIATLHSLRRTAA